MSPSHDTLVHAGNVNSRVERVATASSSLCCILCALKRIYASSMAEGAPRYSACATVR
jgi:hypothetical protein